MKKIIKDIILLIAVVLIFVVYIPNLVTALRLNAEVSKEEYALVDFSVSRVYLDRSYGFFDYQGNRYDGYYQDGGKLKKDDVVKLYYYPNNNGGLIELIEYKKTIPIATPLIIVILNTIMTIAISTSLYIDFNHLLTIKSIKRIQSDIKTKKYKKRIKSQS